MPLVYCFSCVPLTLRQCYLLSFCFCFVSYNRTTFPFCSSSHYCPLFSLHCLALVHHIHSAFSCSFLSSSSKCHKSPDSSQIPLVFSFPSTPQNRSSSSSS
eukprot:999673_1